MEPLERPILYFRDERASTPQGPFSIALAGLYKLLIHNGFLIP